MVARCSAVVAVDPDPTVGLVFYDLKHCLRSIAEGTAENGTARRMRKKAGDAA